MTKVDGLVRKILNELKALDAGYARITIHINGPASPKRARKLLQKITDLEITEEDERIEATGKSYEIVMFYDDDAFAEAKQKVG